VRKEEGGGAILPGKDNGCFGCNGVEDRALGQVDTRRGQVWGRVKILIKGGPVEVLLPYSQSEAPVKKSP